MKLFSKKEKFILGSEQQKEEFIQKLENAHIDYVIREDNGGVSNGHTSYMISIDAADKKKIV